MCLFMFSICLILQVFGGSWGSTLALAYSQSHPDKVTGIILRGIFLMRKKELDWFYEGGAAAIYPDGMLLSFYFHISLSLSLSLSRKDLSANDDKDVSWCIVTG
ncbi:hypothetical protein CsSME_00047975 [Camellia sinensis var. sinensis]